MSDLNIQVTRLPNLSKEGRGFEFQRALQTSLDNLIAIASERRHFMALVIKRGEKIVHFILFWSIVNHFRLNWLYFNFKIFEKSAILLRARP